jgi:hypothetical protein
MQELNERTKLLYHPVNDVGGQPAGTEGWTEAQLAELVTRDTMIGVTVPRVPTGPGRPSSDGRRAP